MRAVSDSSTATNPKALVQPPLWLAAAWGFAEATLFFIIPDLVLTWAALSGVRAGLRTFAAIVAGAVVGGLLMFGLTVAFPDQTRRAVATVPFVRVSMFDHVNREFADHGVTAMLRAPGNGIPYKVYAVTAPDHTDATTFTLMSGPARIERMALSWFAFTALGWIFRHWITQHPTATTALFALFWILVYAIYWSVI